MAQNTKPAGSSPTTPPVIPAAPNPDAAPQSQDNGSVLTLKTDEDVSATKGSYVVAPGRTVVGDDSKSRGPGEKVSLSKADAERFLELGFLLDGDGAIVVRADGPAVNVEDGVQIAQPGT